MSRAYVPESLRPAPDERSGWPHSVPAIALVVDEGLEFHAPVTFLVGANGSGKSTLVEAIAEGFKLDAAGGRAAVRTGRPDPIRTPLGEILRLDLTAAGARMAGGPRRKKKGFFLRAETAFALTENLAGVPGYWEADTSSMSHGEGFLAVFAAMLAEPGFYVLDEPESGLSFESCLHLVALMHTSAGSGAQVVCATHSPILASTPGADIVELDGRGIRRTRWEDLALVDHWRRYLGNPGAYLRHVLDEPDPDVHATG